MQSSKKLFIFAHDSVSPQGREGQDILVKGRLRTLSSRSKSRKFELSSKERNRNVRVGCIVAYYNISRRGLTRVAYPKREAMREPGTWDKREVVTPTSFIYNLKQIAETWEVNRSADIRSWQNWYRMKKKIIVPSVLGILVLIFIVSKIIGGGKIVLDWESSNSSPTLPDTVCLNVYVENSGSMNGYMCNGSNLKDAVYDYVSDLKKNTASCNLFYINSQIIPSKESLDNYIKNLTPSVFC